MTDDRKAELYACFVSSCVDAAFPCLCCKCSQVGGQGESKHGGQRLLSFVMACADSERHRQRQSTLRSQGSMCRAAP